MIVPSCAIIRKDFGDRLVTLDPSTGSQVSTMVSVITKHNVDVQFRALYSNDLSMIRAGFLTVCKKALMWIRSASL